VAGKIPADAVEVQAGNAGQKVRLLSLHDLDRRTQAFRRAEALISAIEQDAGGAEHLTAGARQIIQRGAMLCVLAEHLETEWLNGKPVDPIILCTIANAQRRLLETVGLKRIPQTVGPTLGDLLVADLARQSEAQP
jgi:hypothetical protein